MTKEEAIDNVRSFIGQLTAECQESIHTLIPELAESEDEKVRKALIDGVRQIRCKNGVTQEQMLAWLEKQKPAEWSEEDEKNLERVTDCIYDFYPDPVVKYKLKDWLKSLRSQPHWKPAKCCKDTLLEWAKLVLKCQEEELAKYDGPSYMKASTMGRIDAYKVLIAKLNSL